MTMTDQDYLRLCEPCFLPTDGAWVFGTVDGATDACCRCGALAGVYVVHPNVQQPNLVNAHFPAEATTCMDVLPYVQIIWDANRYYADLGVSPRATKREIREAYQRFGNEPPPRITYIVKQLLDDKIRLLYDSTRLGDFFYDDEIEHWERLAKAAAVAEYRARGQEIPDWLRQELAEDDEDYCESPETVLDTEDDEEETLLSHPPRNLWGWRWAYYVWRSRQDDLWRLARWQEHLISALAQKGARTRITVGFLGGDLTQPWAVELVGYRIVVFLHEDESPTEELAYQAASRVVELYL